jgi:hypothetical protein
MENSEPRYTLECFPIVIIAAAIAITVGKEPAVSGTAAKA